MNRPLEPSDFAALEHDVTDYLRGRDLFVQDLAGGADPRFRLPVRVVRGGVDFDADTLTEITRAAFPIGFIDGHGPSGAGGHPTDVVMLTPMRSA